MTDIAEVAGITVGHWTGEARGVTVVVCPPNTVGSGEVRGGAPATREIALLDPVRTVEHIDAVVLSGGSVFGLAAAQGVVEWLAEAGRGFMTSGGNVPIVPAAAIFDLAAPVGPDGGAPAGSPMAWYPGPDEGRAAAVAAHGGTVEQGRVGAGRGALVGRWRGAEHAVAGGLGSASTTVDGATIGALAVVNAVGDVIGADGSVLAGSMAPPGTPGFPDVAPFEATTLVVVATDAICTKVDCHLLAMSGHHGLARAIEPSHTRYDGDLVIALATGSANGAVSANARGAANLDRLRVAATAMVAEAVRNAVRPVQNRPPR